MRTRLIASFTLLILTGCTSPSSDEIESSDASSQQTVGRKFFDYDAIDHYTIEFEEANLNDLFENQKRSALDSIKMNLILGDLPNSLSEVTFVDKLAELGFKKSSLSTSKFSTIDALFAEKSTRNHNVTACITIYRDILLFKKENSVVGTAKICFGCGAHQIQGTSADISSFGQDGDYEKLQQLLKQP